MNGNPQPRPLLARAMRALAAPVILGWLLLTIALNLLVPQIEAVGRANSLPSAPQDAPSVMAAKKMGAAFGEFRSDSAVMVLIEGRDTLGEAARRYDEDLVARLRQDTKHVEHVQDFWGDRITAAGAQSSDGKAAYTQVNLAGDQGTPLGNESVRAVRRIAAETPPPDGVSVYVTGQAALSADMSDAGDKSMILMMAVTIAVIAIMLLVVYRSISTVLLILFMVFVEMGAARGVVAVVGDQRLIGFSTFAVSLLTALAIAAGTDYAIFLVGRYHESRNRGESPEDAYDATLRGVPHVILGSGLTVAGATFCLYFTRLTYFKALAIPSSAGLLVVLAAALTLGPAVLWLCARFGLLEPKRPANTRRWRKIGAVVARWPGPVLAGTAAAAIIGMLGLAGYETTYNDRFYIPADEPANTGYEAAEHHFSAARMNPDILMVQADHDMRNPSDMILLDRIAKNVFRAPGVAMVQSITRPLGSPIEHSSIPFQVSMQTVPITENLQFMHDRMADMLTMADQIGDMTAVMGRMQQLVQRMAATTDSMAGGMAAMNTTVEEMRDRIADFEEILTPVRDDTSWEQHCDGIPVCWSVRSAFEALDGVDRFTEPLAGLLHDIGDMNTTIRQLAAQLPTMIEVAQSMRSTILVMHSSFAGLLDQMGRMTDTATAMGRAFDSSKSDDYFYLPPEAFQNPDFQRGLTLFLSPDGAAARFIITHDNDPATPEGVSHVDAERQAARDAVRGTPLAGAQLFLSGTAATFKDIQKGSFYDLLIAGVAAITLILIVMLVVTRALIASLVIVGTVLLSLGASFGLSVLLWQHILGIKLHWIVLAFSVIILLAVGSDYNLLVVSRFKEELGAGMRTGLVRAMGATGGVVTAAGLVFAVTMGSMATSSLRMIGQGGATIGLGLLFDTLVVRSFMTPAIASLLGRWFWWPLNIPARPRRGS
ncbi:Transport protein [Segniliparus rotundus DSM 44985]|uniref:Transport protein n=1 Tax=Segniliparus rotundus (strain ATCC BAA-972 / CDC 1076 / CIP 108378 / DSM 44985 / JCM 13578) TaxID=640132 RepID=D6ZB19_SEGRD|nr:RND family transporter [Segniliparus rotundus]ADG96778.1 Transport protein [Segniliparus rotundus DSM 44985]